MRSRPCCQPSRIFFERHDPPLPPRQRTPFAGGMALKLLRLRLCRRCSLSRYRRHRRCLFRRRCLYSRLSRLHHLYSRLIWCRHCNHCLIWHCDHSSGGWGKPAWAPPINPADISSLAINTNIVGRGPARHTRLISPVALPRPLCAPPALAPGSSLLRVADTFTYFSQEPVSASAMVRNPRPAAAHHLDGSTTLSVTDGCRE
jgi:hypothetical protein